MSDWNHIPPPLAQQSDSGLSHVPESGFEATEEGLGQDEGWTHDFSLQYMFIIVNWLAV